MDLDRLVRSIVREEVDALLSPIRELLEDMQEQIANIPSDTIRKLEALKRERDDRNGRALEGDDPIVVPTRVGLSNEQQVDDIGDVFIKDPHGGSVEPWFFDPKRAKRGTDGDDE
jgi:hypothetical protein